MNVKKSRSKRGRPTGSQADQEILLGAMMAFAKHGFNNCTVAHILEASGCSRTHFYRFYKNKEQVFVKLVFAGLDSLKQKLTECVTTDCELSTLNEQLEGFFHVYYQHCFSYGELLPLMFEASDSHPEHRHICDGIRNAQVELIGEILQRNHKAVPDVMLLEALVAASERILNALSVQQLTAQQRTEKAVSLSMAMYRPIFVTE